MARRLDQARKVIWGTHRARVVISLLDDNAAAKPLRLRLPAAYNAHSRPHCYLGSGILPPASRPRTRRRPKERFLSLPRRE